MYGAFYPMGKLDHLITGRLYEFMDMQNVSHFGTDNVLIKLPM